MAWQFNSKGMGAALGEGITAGLKRKYEREDREEDVKMKRADARAELTAQALKEMKGYRKPKFDEAGDFQDWEENPEARSRNESILKNLAPQFFEKTVQEAKPAVLSSEQEGLDDLTSRMNAETRRRAAAGDMRPVTMADVQGASPAPVPQAPPSPTPLLENPAAKKQEMEREKLMVTAAGNAAKAKGAAAEADKVVTGEKIQGGGPNGEDVLLAKKMEQSLPGAEVLGDVTPAQPEVKEEFNPTPEMMADIQRRVMMAPQKDADTLVPNATIPPLIRDTLGLPETGQTPASVLKALLDFKKPSATAAAKPEVELNPELDGILERVAQGTPAGTALRMFRAATGRQPNPREEKQIKDAAALYTGKTAPAAVVAEREAKKEARTQEKEDKLKQSNQATASIVVQDGNRILEMIKKNPRAVGPWVGDIGKYVPGTGARTIMQMLDTIKANTSFDKLQAMRAASPTGGALGQVSDSENRLLQATIGKLDVSLPRPVFEDNLKRVINQYNDTIHGPGGGPKRYKLSFDEEGRPAKGSAPQGTQRFMETSAFVTKKLKEVDANKSLSASEKRSLKKQYADRFEEITGVPWGKP